MKILGALITAADMVYADTMRSIMELERGDHTIDWRWFTHSITSAARNVASHAALSGGYDALFFADLDMTFHPRTVVRLAGHLDDDHPIVSGLYRARRGTDAAPYFAFNFDPSGRPYHIAEIDMQGPVLVPVHGVPTGCLMIATSVFRRLTQPYFWYEALAPIPKEIEQAACTAAETSAHIDLDEDIMRRKPGFARGEDLRFCATCCDLGIPIHIDTRLVAGHLAVRSMGTPAIYP